MWLAKSALLALKSSALSFYISLHVFIHTLGAHKPFCHLNRASVEPSGDSQLVSIDVSALHDVAVLVGVGFLL